MLTVIYSKDNASEARLVAAALSAKSSEKSRKTNVQLVSLEHLKAWNLTASNLHVSLVEVSSAAATRGIDPVETFSALIEMDYEIAFPLMSSLLFLKALLRESPASAEIGWQVFDSHLLTLLGMVLQNTQLIPAESTFRNQTLADVLLVICEDTLRDRIAKTLEGTETLNG
jgi:hypothetical protein